MSNRICEKEGERTTENFTLLVITRNTGKRLTQIWEATHTEKKILCTYVEMREVAEKEKKRNGAEVVLRQSSTYPQRMRIRTSSKQ
jgi:hypothetical protein